MSFEQIALVVLLGVLMAVFALDRWRIEVVALAGLAAAFLLGLVPARQVFAGFADPAVVTVVEILIIAQMIGRSRSIDLLARSVFRLVAGEAATVAVMCGLGAVLSAFMNNIGALALMIPVAYSVCGARGLAVRTVLIPLSYATLLGGLCSLVGTPANLVVNGARIDALGSGFGFFAFAPVGVPLTVAGLAWLSLFGWRLLAQQSDKGADRRFYPTDLFLTEVVVPAGSELIGQSVRDIEGGNGISIHGTFRGDARVFARKRDQVLAEGDLLLMSGSVAGIRRFMRGHGLQPAVSEPGLPLPADRVWTEIVVMPQSTIIGSAIDAIGAFRERGIQVVGISPQGPRIEGRLRDVAPGVGDILLLRGRESDIGDALEETQCVPVAAPSPLFGAPDAVVPVATFAAAIALATAGLLPPEIAFGLAILVLLLLGTLDLRAALREMNWPVVVMLAAMLPVGEALYATGTAELLARAALGGLGAQPPVLLIGAVLLAAVLVTPFLNNVTTAVMLAPVAVSVAEQAGLPVSPLLIAVAVGASTDFLTPFGHHNNTLVMGLGGYSFLDFPRVGLPLTLAVLILAPPLLAALA